MYTTFVVARAAGYDEDRAHVISFFSQMPDLEDDLDAIGGWTDWFTFLGDARVQNKAVLHSLHGGGPREVRERRRDLQAMIHERIGDPSKDWQTGILVHSFGDAFAHTKHDGSAYGDWTGHAHDGETPDKLYTHADIYEFYVMKLFDAVATDPTPGERRLLELLVAGIIERVHRGESEEQVLARVARDQGFDESEFWAQKDGATIPEVRDLMDEMEERFENGG